MEFIDFFLHIDQHLAEIIRNYGTYTYIILFAVIFLETGIIVSPFLPGDSLIFAAALFAAKGELDINILATIIPLAAIMGDTVNYSIGKFIGPKIFTKEKSFFFNRDYLNRTQRYYEKHGGKTLIIARFMPIFRTLAPFVAGVGKMRFRRFISFSVAGGLFWTLLFTFAGYYFGNLQVVKENFTLVILAVVFVPMIPFAVQYLIKRCCRTREIDTL